MRPSWHPLIIIAATAPLTWWACTGSEKDTDTDVDSPEPVIETADTAEEVIVDTEIVDTDLPPVITGCVSSGDEGLAKACDFSVNNASATIDESLPDKPLSLNVQQSAPTPAGAYNGAGTGNRAIAGFHDHDRLRISNLLQLSVDLEFVSGSNLLGPELGLILDLECDSGDLYYALVPHSALVNGVDQGGGITRYTILPEDRMWAVNNELPDPAGGGLIIAPDPDLNPELRPLATLDEIVAAYPGVCLRNIDSGDAAMPFAAATSGILITLGRSTTILRVIWRVHRFVVNDVVYEKP
jgi:hypothetical protein